MTLALVWLAFAYGVLKLASVLRAGPPGFRRAPVPLRDRLRAREPWLLFAAALLAVPPALLASHYAHRTTTGYYAISTACYGRLMALKDRPAFQGQADGYAVYERIQDHRDMALRMAADLDMTPQAARTALAHAVTRHATAYAALRRRGLHRDIEAGIARARRCLYPPTAEPDGAR